jgi:DEAD/DEAH box helicase domain-containing protein
MVAMAQLEMDFSQKKPEMSAGTQKKRVVVFDIETRLSADEVGGWNNKNKMRVAVAVAHDSANGEFKVFFEEQVPELLTLLKSADLVVGFNSRNFDYAVLGGYTEEPLHKTLPTLDLLEEIEKRIGFRLKLDSVAQTTLGVGKTADGLQSLKWVKEGKFDLVRDYCIQDVKVTLEVFNYAVDKKELFYSDKKGTKVSIKLDLDLSKFYRK